MRIGDVGAVSHTGDLLAFSLSAILVLSLVFGIETGVGDDRKEPSMDIVQLMTSIRSWSGFDPDGDTVLEVGGRSDDQRIGLAEFPFKEEITVTFSSGDMDKAFRFVNGSLDRSDPAPVHCGMVHGCSVMIDREGDINPALLEVSVLGAVVR